MQDPLSTSYPVLPLRDIVVFPHMIVPLFVGREKSVRALEDVMADDKRVEKKDRTINEPVQFYTSGTRTPYEVVVNEIRKDQVIGYLSVPKVKIVAKR